MTETELLEQFDVSICEFDSSQWPRNGFIDPINRVVYINKDLAPEIRLKVIFNYIHFMEKYNLTTICDETFVKNEYLKMMRN